MPLPTGTRLGPYEVIGPLGAGGMGEVYRARDSRLNRDVAVKVSVEDLSDRPERRARFEKEARAVAALNHPNIVSIFDFGEREGLPYTVSEVIEGESLRTVLQRGPVPVRKLIDIAVQIAEGLAAAHAAGIAHRDLKPENIMITGDGRVKILDFGLARQRVPSGSEAATTFDTQPGTLLGTVNYMSPEQARGLPVDHRSDQFSLGLILYEMATGNKAFAQDSSIETLAAIVKDEPVPIEARLPPPLRWTIDRCLAKEPRQRYESTLDLARELRALRDHLSEAWTAAPAELAQSQVPPRALLWKLVSLALGLVLAGSIFFFGTRQTTGIDISRESYTPFAVNGEFHGKSLWSPDGKAVAYTAGGVSDRLDRIDPTHDRVDLFVRFSNSLVPTQLTHDGNALDLGGWSPDSKRILFMGRTSGSPVEKPAYSVYSIAALGGEPEPFSSLPFDRMAALTISPDSRSIAVFGQQGGGKFTVFVRHRRALHSGNINPHPLPVNGLLTRATCTSRLMAKVFC